MPDITVFFLQASRSIRPVWLLEELNLPYKIEFANRVSQKAPQDFKDKSGNPLGKFPTLKDGDLTVFESGAIIEYICDKYDTNYRYLPKEKHLRTRVQRFVHAAEGTLALHGLAILYARWQFPDEAQEKCPEALEKMENSLSVNVQNDLNWLDAELGQSTGRFLVGDSITAADIMMHFSVRFILERQLGVHGKSWSRINDWLQLCENSDSYKRAVENTGHTLYPTST